MTVWVEGDDCTECELCIGACPYGAIAMDQDKGSAVINERCTGCGACIEACEFEAIQSDISDEVPDLSGFKGVWIFAQRKDGKLHKGAMELLGCGRELADELGQELVAVLLTGERSKEVEEELGYYGADGVFTVYNSHLDAYQTNGYCKVISELISDKKPAIMLFPATNLGRDLAPRIARRLEVGLTADCTGLSIDKESKDLLQVRPAYGGNLMATIVSPRTRPQLATVRPGIMKALERDENRKCRIENVDAVVNESDLKTKVVEFRKAEKKPVDLSEASIIVAGGRGIGSKEGFAILQELADAIGGEVAGSRFVIEQGWLPLDRQVGQTGQTVRADLYIACGISGAIQHKSGMENCGTIIAINRDPDAPIHQIANYSVVADLFEIVPELTRALKGVSE